MILPTKPSNIPVGNYDNGNSMFESGTDSTGGIRKKPPLSPLKTGPNAQNRNN